MTRDQSNHKTRQAGARSGYVLGVDVGNTKTIALVGVADGSIVGVGRAECGDIYGAPSAAAALEEIERAVRFAVESAGVELDDLLAGAFSAAGADWPEDYAYLESELGRRRFGRKIVIANDAIGALYAGSPDATGVVVVLGTGAAVGARTPDGRFWHTSFWQEPQGARELASKALKAVYRAELGIDEPTALTPAALEYFGQESVEKMLHEFTARDRPRPAGFGGFARVLLDVAAAADQTALDIVRRHGEALGDYALAAARRAAINGGDFTLVLSGGVLRHPSHLLTDAIVARVRRTAPDVRPIISRWEPAAGALLMAYEAAGILADDALRERMEATMPPLSLFAT